VGGQIAVLALTEPLSPPSVRLDGAPIALPHTGNNGSENG